VAYGSRGERKACPCLEQNKQKVFAKAKTVLIQALSFSLLVQPIIIIASAVLIGEGLCY
jgi:hypothetical protein